jgi:hypothetical protein
MARNTSKTTNSTTNETNPPANIRIGDVPGLSNALVAAGEADAAGQSAKGTLEARCFEMLELGLEPSDLRGANGACNPIGRHREEALGILATATLNEADLALYVSDGVENATVEVNGKKQRQKTPKGQVRNRVSQSLGRIIAKMVALSSASAGRTSRTLSERFLAQSTAALKAIEKNRTSEEREFDDPVRAELTVAFGLVAGLLDPQKPTTPADRLLSQARVALSVLGSKPGVDAKLGAELAAAFKRVCDLLDPKSAK